MTNFDPSAYSKADNAFVPNDSNPFLSGGILDAGQDLFSASPSGPQMMPVGSDYLSDLSGLELELELESQPQAFTIKDLRDGSSPVLQALANELAPIYPQVAKALTAPTLDNALQSGVELFSRSSQLLENSMDSGRRTATATVQGIGGSVRDAVDSSLARWRAEDNAMRTGLTQQAETFLGELKTVAAEVDDSRWMAEARHRLASVRQRMESATDGVFEAFGYLGSAPFSKEEAALNQAQLRLRSTLVDLRESSDFAQTFETAFGDSWTPAEAKAVIDDVVEKVAGPGIAIVSASALLGEGAFGDNTIFVSDEVVANAAENPAAIDTVLLEEVGHYFDQALNTVDSAGDEGAIFAKLVQGNAISAVEMLSLKEEDDTSTLLLNNKAISVENQVLESKSSTPILGSDRGMHSRAGTVANFDRAFAQQQKPSAPVTQPTAPISAPPVEAVSKKVEQLTSDAALLSTVSPYASQAMEQEATELLAEKDKMIEEENRQQIEELKSASEILSTASPYASQAMNTELEQKPSTPVAQPTVPTVTEDSETVGSVGTVQIKSGDTLWEIAAQNGVSWTELRKPDGTAFTESDARSLQVSDNVVLPVEAVSKKAEQLTSDAALLSTVSPYVSQAMEQEATEWLAEKDKMIEEEERQEILRLNRGSEILSTVSPDASQAMNTELEALIEEETAPNIEELKSGSEILSTVSPDASQAMNQQAEQLIATEKRETIKSLQNDAELLSTVSPYASQATQAEAEALIDEAAIPEIDRLKSASEILSTASPYASQAMQAEAEALIQEEKRQKIEQLQDDAELLATVSPYAAQAMQAEVDDWFAEERRQEIRELNLVDGRVLEHRFMGTNPEAAELLGTGNYADNFLGGFDLDLIDAEQAANDYDNDDDDNHVMLQSIFDPVVADKETTIDEYSVQVDLPEDVSPDDILLDLATDMDGFLGGEFDELGDFKNQGETPAVGQVIDVDVKDGVRLFGWQPWFTESPFNAPIIITEIEDSNFTVQTIEYNNIEHLLHGTREWGYEKMPDGTVKFYTRGISVEDTQAAEGLLWIDGAKEGEYRFWNAHVDGIENYVVEQGGSVVPDSRINIQTSGPSGNDIWETLSPEQQEIVREEQINGLNRELERHLEDSKGSGDTQDFIVAEQKTGAIENEIKGWENR